MTNGAFPGDLADLAKKLSQNPELRDMIASLVSQNGGERQNETHADEAKTTVPDLSALSSLITPEMMASLPSLMSALGASGAPKGGTPNDGAFPMHGENVSEAHHSPDGGKNSHPRKKCGESERRALLNALRPFLSENRCRALDMMIGMEKLGLVRTMKG